MLRCPLADKRGEMQTTLSRPPEVLPADSGTATAKPNVAVAKAALDDLHAARLGRLTPQLAHELRNALTGVRCYFEILGTAPLPAELAGLLGEVQAAVERMTDLAGTWVDRVRGRAATGYLNGAVGNVVGFLQATGFNRKLRFELDLDPEAGMVAVSPQHLESALLVLIADLLDGSPGVLKARTRWREEVAWVELRAMGGPQGMQAEVHAAVIGEALGARVQVVYGPEPGFDLSLPASTGNEDSEV